MSEVELTVERGAAAPQDLQETLDAVLAELRSGEGELAEEAAQLGIEIPPDLTIDVREREPGLEPIATAIILAFAGGAGKAFAERIWDDLIRPEVRRRRGADAVGPASDGG